MTNALSDDIRRFILTLPSVPHLEAILLFHGNPEQSWEADALARQLYIGEEQALQLLEDLSSAGICGAEPAAPRRYVYLPESSELDGLIGRVASFYSQNLIEVTNIIHANSHKSLAQKARQFADAFRLRKEKK